MGCFPCIYVPADICDKTIMTEQEARHNCTLKSVIRRIMLVALSL